MSAQDDGLDPAEFLRGISELRAKSEQEDSERFRQLEEDIIQGRNERLARRAERARSISPEKASYPGTPASLRSQVLQSDNANVLSSPVAMTPPSIDASRSIALTNSSQPLTGNGMDSTPSSPSSSRRLLNNSDRPVSPFKASPSAASPTRAGTLSWQRRPTSSSARSRPLSMFAAENSAAQSPRVTPDEAAAQDTELSKSQIAESLGSKDPAWFRQTADRGVASAAYRRNQDDGAVAAELDLNKRQLPGLSRPAHVAETDKRDAQESVRTASPSRFGSIRGRPAISDRAQSAARPSDGSYPASTSPLHRLESQRFAPPTSDRPASTNSEQQDLARTSTMSPSQGRITTDRPPSPTKGMGGFVQSAMLKRSDSVNKRWSAQTGPTLSRQNSAASMRSGYGSIRNGFSGLAGSHSMPRLDDTASRRESSAEPSSRPGSSHSTANNTAIKAETDNNDGFAKPALPHHARSKSVASPLRAFVPENTTAKETSPPPSPSKRWSPTKSSWLESALTRPESPKPTASLQQPSWMTELNKTKQQKHGVDETRADETRLLSDRISTPPPVKSVESPFGPSILRKVQSRDIKDDEKPRSSTPPFMRTQPHLAAEKPETGAPKKEQFRDTANSLTKRSSSPSMAVNTGGLAQKIELPAEEPRGAAKEHDVSLSDISKVPGGQAIGDGSMSEKTSLAKNAASHSALPSVSAKPKPETPPKKDFRSTLKARQGPAEVAVKEEPEFKNFFGKLRRTQTEKYVAPDELKNNILRGKAGLALTDGPKKTDRRDELKESLLKKKEEMKAKMTEDSTSDAGKSTATLERPTTPEALAKRRVLGRPESVSAVTVLSLEKTEAQTAPEVMPRKESSREKTNQSLVEEQAATETFIGRESSNNAIPKPPEKKVSAPSQLHNRTLSPPNKLADRFNPALVGILAHGPPPIARAANAPQSTNPSVERTPKVVLTGVDAEMSSTGPLTHITKSRARGPKRRKPNAKDTEPEKEAPKPSHSPLASQQLVQSENPLPSAPLARMPLQPAPKSAAVRAVSGGKPRSTTESTKPTTPTKSSSLAVGSISDRSMDAKIESPKPITSPKSPKPLTSPKSPKPVGSPKPPKPVTSLKSPLLDRKISLSVQQSKPNEVAPHKESVRAKNVAGPRVLPSLPSVHDEHLDANKENDNSTVKLADAVKENADSSVKSAAALWGRRTPSQNLDKPRSRTPIKMPTKKDEEMAMKFAGLLAPSPERPKPSTGLGLGIFGGLQTEKVEEDKRSPSNEYPLSPPVSAGLPPKPAKSSRVVSESLKDNPVMKGLPHSPIPHTSEAGRLLSESYGDVPRLSGKLEIDTQAVLDARPADAGAIKTLRTHIQEITGDGKMNTLPNQEEHILYENSMYICTHVYGSASSPRTTEVFLWAGIGASEVSVEDAQLFAKRVAKDAGAGSRNDTKLQIVRQGHEPALFFAALGGIVITRRGSRADSSKPYIVCVRRHLGHIAIDEVDLSLDSLCSGFPYIVVKPITIQETKLYLWKGAGCGAEELGSARLIGMDLNPTGETIEIDENAEPQHFLDIFRDRPVEKTPTLAGYWHKKAVRNKEYNLRLFRIARTEPAKTSSMFWPGNLLSRRPSWKGSSPSPTRQQQEPKPSVAIKELVPFAQSDLEPEGVYVLDAFFEIYVLVGPLAPSLPNSTHTLTQALLFAQDYAILAASLEDRPSIPKGSVVLSGLPRDVKFLFRQWDDRRGAWGTGGIMAGVRNDGNDLRVVALDAALAAVTR
ncbi:hypothetical protein LTR66_002903 [Elasticomyces elasticus]|nr:hypothetical protein LTR66_002903 [Elasticomyces elasticus]